MSAIATLLQKGGIMMYPLLLTSVFGLAVFIERALFLRRRRIIREDVLSTIDQIQTAEDTDKALFAFKGQDGPFLNIIRTGLEKADRPRAEIKEAIEDKGRQEIRSLERGLVVLETIAGIAPLMGLLGTVIGMIKVFQVISEQGLGQTQALSVGISEALVTTVVGLSIAIPAFIAYNFFTHRTEDLVLEIEKHSAALLDRFHSFQKKS
ncbi:MotA/TolQ/ExbB proton channel family protein [bacterium]|nr:MotA/TolQ/ExbB proton channel family protein [bacterium]